MTSLALPSRRDEAWKYSDLRAALAGVALPQGAPAPAHAWRKLDGIIDQLALAQGHHAITKVHAGEEETIVEHVGGGAFEARVREIQVLPGGSLTRVLTQTGDGVALDAAYVSVSEGASFKQFVLMEGGKLARSETHVEIEGEGAEVALNGVYLVGEGRHADLTSTVTHKATNAQTRQLVKGVARKGGRGVFHGRIIVPRGANGTDARQHHRALMLEDGAEIDAKPELEIYADDVACAHGNAIGALDDAQLFYARSRGIPEHEARALLIEAFLVEAIPEDLQIRDELVQRVQTWLRGAA